MITTISISPDKPTCKPLLEWNPQRGDTFLSADGKTVVLIVNNDIGPQHCVYFTLEGGVGPLLPRLVACNSMGLNYRRVDLKLQVITTS